VPILHPQFAGPPLKVETQVVAREAVRVVVAGELDLSNTDRLRETLLDALRTYRPTALELDLAGVGFIDSSAINTLVRVRNAALELNCRVVIVAMQPFVRRVLAVIGVLELFEAPADG
jgi:anti-anti-sigma factor